jgi:molecular chaperone DnaK
MGWHEMSSIIGIDLGTTSSRVAIIQGRRPVIIENSEGEGTTPSYVALTSDGTRLVGEGALRYSLEKPENVIFAVKN